MEQTIYKNDLQKASVLAAQKASKALQQLIAPETRLIVSDVEVFEKPQEMDATKLAEKCVQYYKQGNAIVFAPVKIYEDDGVKRDAGSILMFIDQENMTALGNLILQRLAKYEDRVKPGMLESAITEALNIIGNAYIEIVSEFYKTTIMSMVPEIIDTMTFDGFIGEMISVSNDKTYVVFDTTLFVTKSVIKIPFLLAVSLLKDATNKQSQ
jgi:chemotaxis protein CheY-P-specific phosphatase CheC